MQSCQDPGVLKKMRYYKVQPSNKGEMYQPSENAVGSDRADKLLPVVALRAAIAFLVG